MKIRKNIVAAILLLIGFTACEKETKLSLPKSKVLMVVNSGITSDSTIKIYIGKTVALFDNSSNYDLNNLHPSLRTTEKDIPLINIGKGYYLSNEKPEVGEAYTLEIREEGFPTVSSSTRIPSPPILGLVSAIQAIQESSPVIKITADIVDSDSTEDYYIVEVKEKWEKSGSRNLSLMTRDIACENNINGFAEPQLLLRDLTFNGKTKSFTFTIPDNNYSQSNLVLELVLKKCTKEFWEYKLTYYLYKQTTDVPTIQPVQMFTNINNGVGIFGSYTSTTSAIVLR